MNEPTIRDKPDPLAGFVFIIEGAQTLLGKLHEDEKGHPYLEPVYVYRVGEEFKIDPDTKQKTHVRKVRELHPLFGYPELRRKDIATSVGVSVNDLLPESREELTRKVVEYEDWLKTIGIVTLIKSGSLLQK